MRITTKTGKADYTTLRTIETHARVELVREHGDTFIDVGTLYMQPRTMRKYRLFVRRLVQAAKQYKREHVRVPLTLLTSVAPEGVATEELMRTFAENAHMANYEFTAYKKEPKEGWSFIDTVHLEGTLTKAEHDALALGTTIAHEVNRARDLANTPGGDMTPTLLGTRIRTAASDTSATVRVLSAKELRTLGMGALLGVGKGSKEEPKLIIVEYRGAPKNEQPIVLVGKGITFDTGGLNLKPTSGILDMHLDMSGGAAVAHAVIAAAKAKLKVNAVALIPAAENMPSSESYRPGDILQSMSGKSIDVIDTDAEGRLVLADALTYAARYKPRLVVDVATLTGAALVALGTKASAVLSPDDAFAQHICAMGELSGDYCWQLPLWEEYKDAIKGRFGDVSNVPQDKTRDAGTILGGVFLAEFAVGYPDGATWAHIDMAPRMTSDKADLLAPGAAGAPVRLLVRLLEAATA